MAVYLVSAKMTVAWFLTIILSNPKIMFACCIKGLLQQNGAIHFHRKTATLTAVQQAFVLHRKTCNKMTKSVNYSVRGLILFPFTIVVS